MTDADVFGKLSRIFETHAFSNDDSQLNEFLDDFDPNNPNFENTGGRSHSNSPNKKKQSASVVLPDRPTPYDVWHQRTSKVLFKEKKAPKLNGQQWDRLVDKMHQSNRTKQTAMINQQNQGLALELGGYQFKPRINQTSLELSATMKSLSVRMPEMLAEREKTLEQKRKEAANNEVADCTFAPTRYGSKTSDQYLRKMGREKVTPEDLMKYEQEKQRRIEVRKQIVTEIEDKDLTFRPQMSSRSLKLQEKKLQRGDIDIDPVTGLTVVAATANPRDRSRATRSGNVPLTPGKITGGAAGGGNGSTAGSVAADSPYYEGPMLVIESEHPYRHNTNEYTTVMIPNAVSYQITFTENTKTEVIHDYIKFYDDDTHTEYFGAGKYSGGTNGTSCNWPGVGGRPPLHIISPKFVIYFHTNGTVNDWGFAIQIIPTLSTVVESPRNTAMYSSFGGIAPPLNDGESQPGIPTISSTGKNYNIANATNYTKHRNAHQNVQVHERLYQHAVHRTVDAHNSQIDMYQNRLNIPLKPWENVRGVESETPAHPLIQAHSKTHIAKSTISEAVAELLLPDPESEDVEGNQNLNNTSMYSMNLRELNTSSVSKTGVVTNTIALIKGVPVAVVEYDDLYCQLWRQLRT